MKYLRRLLLFVAVIGGCALLGAALFGLLALLQPLPSLVWPK